MRLSLLLAVATLALQADAKFSFDYLIGRHSGFIRDVRVALRSLTRHNIIPPPVSLPRRSTLSVHPAKCLAVPPGQVPLTDGHSGGGGDNGGSSSSGPRPTGSPGTNSTDSTWNVAQLYAGADFFKGWEFYTDRDPTNGLVQYVSEQQAWDSQLISINSAGNAVMKIDTTPVVQGNRMAVRIKTDYTFNGGLVVLDAVHAPMGCATWPAFWTNGPNWPAGGEIDIFENVNDVDVNQATIHTRSGCTIRDTIASEVTGRPVNSFNCDINAPSVTGRGCGFQTDGGDTYGPGFNSITGGVYAMLWDDSGIKVWFWRRGVIPKNVLDRQPLPDLWGKPFAFWPSDNCNSHDFFHDHNAIFTNTLCGDWAGNTWHSTGLPGQDQSCADRTGVATCEQFVRQNGSAFANAYWEVKSVVIYQQQ